MDDATLLRLEEWKARYESYRAYRAQYLTTMSLASTGIMVATGLAFQSGVPPNAKALLISLACLGALMLVVAHIYARRAIRDLGVRLSCLESALGFGQFHTTWMLETSLIATLWASVAMLLALLWLLGSSMAAKSSTNGMSDWQGLFIVAAALLMARR